jgi:hypothetical protein
LAAISGVFDRVTAGAGLSSCSAALRRTGRLLADLAGYLSGFLTDLPGHSAGCLTDATSCLAGGLSQALSKATERLAGALGGLRNGTAGAQRLTGRVGESSKRLTRGAAWADSLLRRLADIAESLAHGTTGPERLLAEIADVSDGVVDGLDEALQDLGVPIERRQRAVENVVEVLQTHLQLGLCLDPLDVDLDLAQAHVDTRHDLQQVRELRPEREMRLQPFDVDVDLIDLHLPDVDEDIRIVARFATFELGTVEFARTACP